MTNEYVHLDVDYTNKKNVLVREKSKEGRAKPSISILHKMTNHQAKSKHYVCTSEEVSVRKKEKLLEVNL